MLPTKQALGKSLVSRTIAVNPREGKIASMSADAQAAALRASRCQRLPSWVESLSFRNIGAIYVGSF
jgi:hypothetical protein